MLDAKELNKATNNGVPPWGLCDDCHAVNNSPSLPDPQLSSSLEQALGAWASYLYKLQKFNSLFIKIGCKDFFIF